MFRFIRQTIKENIMNRNRIVGNWKQLKGNFKKQWGKLTDDQCNIYAGKQDILAGIIQESIGLSMETKETRLAAMAKL